MGSIKKALKPVTRVIDDIIPNEIKPALPYIAATFGAPYLAGSSLFGGIGNLALRKGLAGGIANLGTQALLGKKINPTSALFSAATAGGGQFLQDSPFFQDSKFAKSVGEFISPGKLGGMNLKEASTAATTPLTAGTAESAYDAAKKANDEYDQYVQEQQAAGAEDIQTRVDYITRYMGLAGFDQDNINETLNELGYAANGGLMGTRVGYRIGGGPVKSFIAKLLNAEPSEEVLNKMFEERKKEILSGMFDAEAGTGAYSMEQMQKADEMATKQAMQELEEYKMRIGMELDNPPEGSMSDDMIDQIMEPRKEGRVKEAMGGRIYKADGGIMNLNMGGMPAEMDLRGGGFVPLGAKEKADDVPARLSKNEFVMTADAVRAAGGGSVNKGAKRMYDLMNNLEARV